MSYTDLSAQRRLKSNVPKVLLGMLETFSQVCLSYILSVG